MKKIIYTFAALLPLTFFAGCSKDGDENDGPNNEASFKAALLDATGSTATVAVSSTGTEADTWYCFCSSDVTTPVAGLVSAEVSKLGGNIASSLKSGNRQISFENLTPNTDYRAVVTGLLADGTVYGTPYELKFRSGRAAGDLERYTKWNVQMQRGMISQKNVSIADFVVVKDEGDGKEKFFTTILPADQYPGDDKIESFIDECIASVDANLKAAKLSWSDILQSGSTADNYDICDPGEWYAFVIGATDDGKKSGLWNRTEKVTIPPVTGSNDFMKYAGTWTYNNGTQNVDFELIPAISEAEGAGFYIVRGWQGSDEKGPFFPDFTAIYETANKTLSFVSYDMEIPIAVDDKGTVGSLAVIGCHFEGEKLTNVVMGGFPAKVEVSGSTGTITGLPIKIQTGEVQVNCVSIGALVGNSVSLAAGAPKLPCSITKKGAAKSLSVKRFAAIENIQPVVSYQSMAVNMSFIR